MAGSDGAENRQSRRPARVRVWRRVEWIDTDKSGHWHFAAAFRMFEAAETTLWQHLGGKERLGDFPRVHVSASYREKARYLDELAVDLVVQRVGYSSVSYAIDILRDGQPCVQGEMVASAVDPVSGRTVAISADLRRALESAGELSGRTGFEHEDDVRQQPSIRPP